MKQWNFKQNILPNLLIGILFIIAALIYCAPVLEGKVLAASDSINAWSAIQEGVRYHQETGERTWWTGSMFCGMPNYQIGGGQYLSGKILGPAARILNSGGRLIYTAILFYLIAFYILLRAFDLNKWMSAAGAFAITFSSYFLIIIGAGHGGKCMSITWLTLVLVGMLLLYKKQYGWGMILTMFFLAVGFMPHPQMSYYMCLLIGVMFCAELYIHIKEKRMKDWLIATALFVGSFAVGMGTTFAPTLANKEYVTETMRGGHSDLETVNDAENKVSKGLDLDYATAWSYGIQESFTFIIPNYMGAASGYNVGKNSELYKQLTEKGVLATSAKDFCSQAPTYWGTQPFTAGPVYMGAIVCFLFVLALLIVKGPYKWALLVATIFSVLLSWGHNFMWFTRLFFDYFPMYNKFRAVSSILVVAEITVPLLGFLAIKAIANKEVEKPKILKSIYISAGITGGFCLLMALFGKSMLSFTSPNDAQFIQQIPDWVYAAIIDQRAAMLQSDAWRSLIFIVLGAAVIWFYAQEKFKSVWAALALGVLIIGDMWTVDKRFFNDDSFIPKKRQDITFAMQPYEKQILQDQDPHFRVLNLTTSTFNDGRTSYYLKSIGGYSGAKLRRYQDLIDEHLSKMHWPVLNMLNAKYIIFKDKAGNIIPQQNPDAMGNAWFVDSLLVVNTPNAECAALNEIDLHTTAVVDTTQFGTFTENFVAGHDSAAQITLTKYTPEYIEYETSASKPGTVVFSEIYYPYGWKVLIDGEYTEHFRANYALRALNVPAGQHHIRFEFRPDSVRKGDRIALIFIIIMLATIVGCGGWGFYRIIKKNQKE